jgi:diguanylate cyclase (GGDEF)-like protein/PAS domain S-box-containing protein
MIFSRLRYRILAVVAAALALGLAVTAWNFVRQEEAGILADNQRAMHKVTDSVVRSLEALMLAGHADIARNLADRLRSVPEVADFRILRVDGHDAFRDNATIDGVNRRLGHTLFEPRPEGTPPTPAVRTDTAAFAAALRGIESNILFETDARGRRLVTLFDPLPNLESCHRCHGGDHPVRGVVKLSLSMAPVERQILRARLESLLVLGVALAATLSATGYMLGRAVVRPIEDVTTAMAKVAAGQLDQQIPVRGRDELARMAGSFNRMADQLRLMYSGLHQEQDKLHTIIHSAGEGIVVTDVQGRVVLVNPAACRLLGRSAEAIAADGFPRLFGDEEIMQRFLTGRSAPGETVEVDGRVLSVQAATIRDHMSDVVGSAALFRDVSKERQLEKELRRLSDTDALTGLFNRRYLDQALEAEWQRARRYHLNLAVFLFDIDHFKRFNDEHGHDMGDEVLRQVAAAFADDLRGPDIPCRYGGEEFLAILPNTDCAGASHAAERLRQRIESLSVQGLRVTISIGVACIPGHDLASAQDIVAQADAMLYQAKAGGRNRVCTAGCVSAAAG